MRRERPDLTDQPPDEVESRQTDEEEERRKGDTGGGEMQNTNMSAPRMKLFHLSAWPRVVVCAPPVFFLVVH